MKNTLLGTTALIGALALAPAAYADNHGPAAPLTVILGGSLEAKGGIVDEDLDTDRRGYGGNVESNVFVKVEGDAGNGLQYGAKITILDEDKDPDNAAERFIYLNGDFGTIELGEHDGASERLAVYAPNSFGTGGAVLGDYQTFLNATPGIMGLNDTYAALDSFDAFKVTYFSPVFSGFQFGISFAPDGTDSTPSAVALSDTTTSTASILPTTEFQNFFEIGANFSEEFNGVGVEVSVGYVGADAKDSATTKFEDLSSFSAGLALSSMGFTLGGSYVFTGDSGYVDAATSVNTDDAEAYNVGLQYEEGNFVVGANALFASSEGSQVSTSPNDNELTVYSVGSTYTVAPGLAAFVEANIVEFEYEGGTTGNNDATVVIFGSRVNF